MQPTTTGPRSGGSRFFASPPRTCRISYRRQNSRPAKRVAARKTAPGIFLRTPAFLRLANLPQVTETHQENSVQEAASVRVVAGAESAGSNSTLRDSDQKGGGSTLPIPTQAQIDGVLSTYGRYFKFQGSAADVKQMQTLFAQAFLFRRPNGNPSIAIREFTRIVKEYGDGWEGHFYIGFGPGNELMPDKRTISIERTGNIGNLISDGQMVVSIMHEGLHAADKMYEQSLFYWADRHNEIYRMQNQTLYDLGLPLDAGPRGKQIPDGDKYNGSKW
jgi:hypothetical protein